MHTEGVTALTTQNIALNLYAVLKVRMHTAQWRSWLSRRPVTAEVVGSSPIWVACYYSSQHDGILAQLGEHLPYKQGVTGSSPVGPTLFLKGFGDESAKCFEKCIMRRCGSIGRAADL